MKRTFRTYKWLMAALLAVLLPGCSVPLDVVFYNASGSNVELTHRNENQQAEKLMIKNKSTEEIRRLLSGKKFSINRESGMMSYASKYVDEAFIENVGVWPGFERKVKAQLESDGCIYLVPIKTNFPSRLHATQPDGFPLCPQSP